jgi:hypothetical protein
MIDFKTLSQHLSGGHEINQYKGQDRQHLSLEQEALIQCNVIDSPINTTL